MSNDPLYAEKVLDSIKKDLTIENIQQLMFKYKQQAEEWYPNIRFEENPNTESITLILVIGDQNDPVNCLATQQRWQVHRPIPFRMTPPRLRSRGHPCRRHRAHAKTRSDWDSSGEFPPPFRRQATARLRSVPLFAGRFAA